MCADQLGQFGDGVDVAGFEVLLEDGAEVGFIGHAGDRGAGRSAGDVDISADGLEAFGVDELGKFDLPDLLRVDLVGQLDPDLPVGGDVDAAKVK